MPCPAPASPEALLTTPLAVTPFSAQIREASHEAHTEAENSSFMSDMLGGKLGVAAYRRYTEQLWFVYRSLEARSADLAADPVAGPFIRPELSRTAALEADLDHLHEGPGWRTVITPLPATETYAARVTEVAATWPAGYVAHHYTRYLGDLSGGQIIRGTAEKTWGFTRKGPGVHFYVFDAIGNPAAFKREYRQSLDDIAADGQERLRIVEECKRAFALNSAVFQDLATACR
ncbi:biliverdin-producing heme oxygenase [Streptomyces sp. JH002]|uniref:biliverdin-producing heme oxygenase n=1 Tax=Streptomyces sp. JH002 TaxID=2763259 RepID=UPI003D80396D